MHSKHLFSTALIVLLPLLAPLAAATDDRFVVITNAKLVPVEGKELAGATIVISDGKITNMGPSIEYPRNARVIDAAGMTVMPGMILAETRAGLPGFSRRGVNGNLLAADEYYPQDGQFDELLEAGFTTVAVRPSGSGIPGRAAIMQTGGEEENRFLKRESYLYLATRKADLRDALKKAQAEIDKVEKAKKEWDEKQKKAKAAAEKAKQQAAAKAKADQAAGKAGDKKPTSQPTSQPTTQPAKFEPPKIDPALQPLVDLLKDKDKVQTVLTARSASDVLHLLEVLDGYEFRPTWSLSNTGQNDLFKVIEPLSEEEETRVVLRATRTRVPYSAERLPYIHMMERAGCEISLVPRFDSSFGYESLLAQISELVRDGLDREAALAMVTLNPAKMLGLDKERGSLKKDKVADLIFLDGDPLAPGARVRKVMIAGEIVHELEDEQ